MSQTTPLLQSVAAWVVTLLVPVILVVAGVRLLMTPIFLEVEYRTPNFPEDRYGMTLDERLRWSRASLVYLTEWRDQAYLESLEFDDGTPIYNEREIRHVVDVQNVLRLIMQVWLLSIGLAVAGGIWAWLADWWPAFLHAVGRGGLLTALLLGGGILFVLIAFGIFFVFFHQVFFQAGTWTFFYSDTLIRLFPERFWRDSFLVVGLFSGVSGLLLWYFLVRRG
ncbi:MAG: TIGR01906 family membrane protein [Anaerolineales bacterium]|nr:TIGR01906 family membrane protein [Anaerolineales bacterium]